MIRLALIGNCQAPNLRNALVRGGDVEVKYVVDVNDLSSVHTRWCVEKILHRSGIDFVLSQPIGDDFGALSSSNLSQMYGNRFLKITNFYFTGLHPDISYYGSFNMSVPSPLGDYHSKIALTCFLKGYDFAECLKSYRAEIYERMGYIESYRSSLLELERRDASNDLCFAEEFGRITRRQLSVLAVNHPTSVVFAEFAGKILEALTGKRAHIHPDIFINQLSGSVIWPVYPEIGAAHGLPYRTDMLFHGPANEPYRALDLASFVRDSYALYARLGLENMMSIPLAHELVRAEL